jgi:hypothetical protein
LSETEEELRETAVSHGWKLEMPNEVFEQVPPESLLDDDHHPILLYSSDLEQGETTKRIFEAIERVNPTPNVLDSQSEIPLLAGGRHVIETSAENGASRTGALPMRQYSVEPGDGCSGSCSA